MGLQRRGRAQLTPGAQGSLDAHQLAELVQELAALVRGARVRDVQGLPPREFLFVLEPDPALVPHRDHLRVFVSTEPEGARLHLQHGRVRSSKSPPGPFFRRLAAELVGATLVSIAPVRQDRIALLEFRDTPSGERRALLVELFGLRSNAVLLGKDDVVLELLVGGGAQTSGSGRGPRLAVGSVWTAPEGGRHAAAHSRAGPHAEAPAHGVREAFPAAPDEQPPALAPLSWLVERVFRANVEEGRDEKRRKALAARVARKLKKAERLVAGLEARAVAADAVESVRRDGELLKANLGRLARGMTSIDVDDWFTGERRAIALDPKLSPLEAIERVFARSKKLVRAREKVADELVEACAKREHLRELALRVEDGDEDPEALEREAVEKGQLDPAQIADPRRKKTPAPRLPYRAFTTPQGGTVLVGRSARDNDALTIKHARGSDLWLHTADAPGSHVVLRLERGAEPHPEDLLDAAHLAVHFSPLEGARRADVHVARKKEVHKPRGAKPGLVTLSGGRILTVRMQPERLRRLLRSRTTDDGPAPAGDAPGRT